MLILFGGTFDPIHIGHIALANTLYDNFQHTVTFMPTGLQTYKKPPVATATQRLEMLNLTIANNKNFNIDTLEILSKETCNTYKTLSTIRKKIGKETPIFFLIGSDSLITLDSWDNWQDLLNLTNFIVAKRPEFNLDKTQTKVAFEFNKRKTLIVNKNITHGTFYLMNFTPINISSTQIRHNIKNNKPITNLVPSYIEQYILNKGIYK
ncbi:MAG TPA: nicotinate (nicotinamide) nucleotide adenylyltransferase [Burkholderiales bacterium]|mgnify:CR=1 FL=1|nr:nicotinate (nicotinamide) nucleotide adenylyltransferase [Burkholderiales bacterium]